MAKPLKYQPHAGKLKPINSIFDQLQQQLKQQQSSSQINQTQLITNNNNNNRRNSIIAKSNDLMHEKTRLRSE